MRGETENIKKTLLQKERVHDFMNTLLNVGGTRGMQVNAELYIDVGEAFHDSIGNGAGHGCANPIIFFLPLHNKNCVCLCVTHLAPKRNPNPNARVVPQMWNNGRRDVKFVGFA
jgi:hypothetical protein